MSVRGGSAATMTSEEQLSRVRWTGGATYRVLSYYFSRQWNRAKIGRYLHRVLEDFSVAPDPGEGVPLRPRVCPPAYRLVDFGPSTSGRYSLLYPEVPLISSDHVSDPPGTSLLASELGGHPSDG